MQMAGRRGTNVGVGVVDHGQQRMPIDGLGDGDGVGGRTGRDLEMQNQRRQGEGERRAVDGGDERMRERRGGVEDETCGADTSCGLKTWICRGVKTAGRKLCKGRARATERLLVWYRRLDGWGS